MTSCDGALRTMLVVASVGGVVACGSQPLPDGLEDEAARCGGVGEMTSTQPRAAEVGVLEGGAFVPLTDGDAMAVVRGHQGGFMVTPALRVPALPVDADAVCCSVVVTNTVGTREVQVAPGMYAEVTFARAGNWLQSGYLSDLLAYSQVGLDGASMTRRCGRRTSSRWWLSRLR